MPANISGTKKFETSTIVARQFVKNGQGLGESHQVKQSGTHFLFLPSEEKKCRPSLLLLKLI